MKAIIASTATASVLLLALQARAANDQTGEQGKPSERSGSFEGTVTTKAGEKPLVLVGTVKNEDSACEEVRKGGAAGSPNGRCMGVDLSGDLDNGDGKVNLKVKGTFRHEVDNEYDALGFISAGVGPAGFRSYGKNGGWGTSARVLFGFANEPRVAVSLGYGWSAPQPSERMTALDASLSFGGVQDWRDGAIRASADVSVGLGWIDAYWTEAARQDEEQQRELQRQASIGMASGLRLMLGYRIQRDLYLEVGVHPVVVGNPWGMNASMMLPFLVGVEFR